LSDWGVFRYTVEARYVKSPVLKEAVLGFRSNKKKAQRPEAVGLNILSRER
jgi:hypothetical protein